MSSAKERATFEDLLDLSEVKDLLFRAEREMFPKMEGSVISLVIGTDRPDAKLAIEVGAAVLFDKPLLVLVPSGRTIPAGLRRVAAAIIEDFDFQSADAQARLRAAMKSMIERA